MRFKFWTPKYHCYHCGKLFWRASSLFKHYRVTEDITPLNPVCVEPPVNCRCVKPTQDIIGEPISHETAPIFKATGEDAEPECECTNGWRFKWGEAPKAKKYPCHCPKGREVAKEAEE